MDKGLPISSKEFFDKNNNLLEKCKLGEIEACGQITRIRNVERPIFEQKSLISFQSSTINWISQKNWIRGSVEERQRNSKRLFCKMENSVCF